MSFGGSSFIQPSSAELTQSQRQLTDWKALAPTFQKNATAGLARAENTTQRNSLRQGGINASISQAVDANQQGINTGLMQRGTAPTSGQFLMANSGANRTAGISRALAKGVVNNESSYLQGLAHQIQSGQSLLRGTDAARNAIAGLDTQRGAYDVYNKNATMDAIGQGIGTAVGTYAAFKGASPTQKPSGLNSSAFSTSGGNVGGGFGLKIPAMNTGYSQYAATSSGMTGGF